MWNGALWLLLLLLWLDCCVCLLAAVFESKSTCHTDGNWIVNSKVLPRRRHVSVTIFICPLYCPLPPLHKLTTSRLIQSFELFPPVPRMQRSNYVWFSLGYWQSHLLSIYCPVGTARAGSVSWLSGPISKYKNISHSIAVRPMWTYQIRG